MIQDPYKVLGVPTTAADEEVKRAYRQLAKRYHPDANPGDASAERRMKEVNAAYDQIMNKTAAGYGGTAGGAQSAPGGNPFGGGWYTGYNQSQAEEESPLLRAAYNYIQYGRYAEALNVLEGIRERDARWYYYSARANAGAGNRIRALEHARKAAALDPNNLQYRLLLEQLENPGRAYTMGGFGRGFGIPVTGGWSLCLSFCAAQALCSLCCRY